MLRNASQYERMWGRSFHLQSPPASFSILFYGYQIFFHVSRSQRGVIIIKLALAQESKGLFLQICCKFIWAKGPVTAVLLVHAREEFATRIGT